MVYNIVLSHPNFEKKIIELALEKKNKFLIVLYQHNIFLNRFKKNPVEKIDKLYVIRGFFYDRLNNEVRRNKWYANMYIGKEKVSEIVKNFISDFLCTKEYLTYNTYKEIRDKKICICLNLSELTHSFHVGDKNIVKYLDCCKVCKKYSINMLFFLKAFDEKSVHLLENSEVIWLYQFFGFEKKYIRRVIDYLLSLYDRIYRMFVKRTMIYPGLEFLKIRI